MALNGAALDGPEPPADLLGQVAGLDAAVSSAESAVADASAAPQAGTRYTLISASSGAAASSTRLQVLEDPVARVVLGLVLGGLAALLVVLGAERSNPRIDDPATAEAIVGAPVLALVPVLRRRKRAGLARADPADFRGPFAESFRTLRSTLEFRAAAEQTDQRPRIMVASATPGEGKSTTAAFLALAFAQTETPPVVIGGDLRRPSIHRTFGVERVPGLSSRALSIVPPPLDDLITTDPVTGVSVVPSGPSVEHVGPVVDDVITLCAAAQRGERVAIVDTAPVRVASDAVDYLPAVDAVIVVVRIGHSTVRAVTQMVHTLRINEAPLVGIVVMGSTDAADSSRYYYAYYGSESPAEVPPPRPRDTPDLEVEPALA